jgi:hypothetical protein
MPDDPSEGGADEIDQPDDSSGAGHSDAISDAATSEDTPMSDDRPVATSPVAAGPMTGWQRLSQTFLRPPGPARPKPAPVDFSKFTDAERRDLINRIDPIERKVGIAAAILGAVFTLVYSVPFMVSKIKVQTTIKPVNKHCLDGYIYTVHSGAAATCNGVLPATHYLWQMVIGLIFAAAILVTLRFRRRAPLAFAIVLTGLDLGSILIVPFVVAGGWLLLRAWRTQKYGSPTARAPVEGYVRPAPGAGRRPAAGAGGPKSSGPRKRRAKAEEEAPARRPPAPSKRYTPKAPPRKKVPPAE